ncbi:BQ2448_6262 [Microbotryum intermedium]|uniref:BQ2448_6262 protein n=1 Tax=Microbotryum intermedium TaxID=269621 RepID=A0A238FJ74_9BASI|nr:BQ2448_6262 [Microbotryum intermedium]
MLVLNLIAPLLVLVTPLASGMPHSLTSLEPQLDEVAGNWKAEYMGAHAAPTGGVICACNSTEAEFDLLEERAVPNPKAPNFEKTGTTTTKPTTTAKTTTAKTTARTTAKKTTTGGKTVAPEASTTSTVSLTTTSASKTTTFVTTTTTAEPSVHTGQATFFYQDSAGACGNWNADSVPLVALKASLYGDTGKVSKYCGRYVHITNTANGKSVVAIVADACPGCATYYSLDLSTGAFDQIGDEITGVLPISWYFLPIGYSPSSQSATTKSMAPTTAKAKTTTTSTRSSSTLSVSPSTTSTPTRYTGQGTFFFQNGNAGACWVYNKESTPLVALDYRLYGNMNTKSQYCGKYLNITNTANGKSVVAIVADACPTCASKYSLDLSTGAYDQIGDRDTGILPLSWYWL